MVVNMKVLLIVSLLISLSQAKNFDDFLQEAIKKSPYLKANSLIIDKAKQKASITTRYKNPSLELEASNFAEDKGGRDAGGYRIGLAQPLRLWGISDARDTLANRQKDEAKSYVKLNRANFIKKLSLLFVSYKKTDEAKKLAELELEISKKIETISRLRFESGTIAKVKYIQAKVDTQRGKNFLNEVKIKNLESYYALMSFSGIDDEVKLDSLYDFHLNKSHSVKNSPSVAFSKNKQKTAEAKAEVNSNKIEWITAFGEFEKEPAQGISRIGVNIPLAIFNSKTQEKQIAKLQAKSSEFMTTNQTNAITLTLKKLDKSIEALSALEISSKELLSSQNELLLMYEDAYKIANINLIELQMVKNQMIRTKERLINIQSHKEKNIIQHNFLTGEYNE